MTNQLPNRVQPVFEVAEPNQSMSSDSLPPDQSADERKTDDRRSSASLGLWFGSQAVQHKYLLGWLTSGILSIAGIASAGVWFTTAVHQVPTKPTGVGQAQPNETQRAEVLEQRFWQQQLLAIALVIATNTGVMLLLYRMIAKPVKRLQQDTQMFSLGDREIRAEVKATDEIGRIAQTFNQLADNTVTVESLLSEQTRQHESRAKETQFIRQLAEASVRTEQDLAAVFEQVTQSAKDMLGTDRVVIYRFNSDWSGSIVTECVSQGWSTARDAKIKDGCISDDVIDAYRRGRVVATDDVLKAEFHPEHLKLLTRLQVKASLVTPILKDDHLYGLLIAHHCTAASPWHPDEIDFLKALASQLGLACNQVTFVTQEKAETERAHQLYQQKKIEAEQAQQLYQISSRLRSAFSHQEIYNTAVRGVQEMLNTDRAIVYLFDAQWKGSIVAEVVESGYPSALGTAIADPCFAERYAEKYKQGRVQAWEDIANAGLTKCHLKQLEPFQVRASMVAPILATNTLHGLLVTHQCSRTRSWEEPEMTFFREVAAQMGLALDLADVLHQLERSRQQAEQLAEEQRQQREALQSQLVSLLDQVEGVASGDLTVRAQVTDGELGTVADFFNALVESLRQIVLQVKRSTTQVNMALGESELTIQQLAAEALQQSEDITQTLNSVDQMTMSIQAVAESSRQAAAVTHTASSTAEASQVAIDFTVHSIFELRETMSETAQKMKRLGESSQAISKVISLINQIALKTNMLALNAGIEAARTGENGAGFAVVAEEVGELAVQSASATKEIEQLVEDIQRGTRQVLEVMEKSTTQMVQGTRLVEDAKQNLGQLRELSQQTDQLVQSISEATIAQTDISQAVSLLMQKLAHRSRQTASVSQHVTDSLQQTVGIAQALELSVSAFTVEDGNQAVITTNASLF
ncbi:MAG: GAF domain-containing protein [Stenomitos rutilans HA7619-LM2]|jgi:methyl-accepting chemotaxis protein|nr:GAF domain-containing protein [Stenomitos rutilans HA7619-LM2]